MRVSASRARRVGQRDAQAQLVELRRLDARCVHQQVLTALRLRERDHVAQALGAGEQHRDAVEAEGEAAVRRRAGVERVQHEAEARLHVALRVAEQLEDLALHVAAVIAQAARAELEAVHHDVVVRAAHALGLAVEEREIFLDRRDEGHVHEGQLAVLVALEDREVQHEERRPGARRRGRAGGRDRCAAGRGSRSPSRTRRRAKKSSEPGRAPRALGDAGALRSERNFAIGDCHEPSAVTRTQARPFAPSSFFTNDSRRSISPRVSASASWIGRHFTTPPFCTAAPKARNSVLAEQIGQLDEFQQHARVGLVRAVARHRVGVGEARERAREFDAAGVAPRADASPPRAPRALLRRRRSDISKSICVNSSWRSARRSSSRKQRAIWK